MTGHMRKMLVLSAQLCLSKKTKKTPQQPSFPPSETRLVNGSSRCSGRIEVFRNQQWGTVCDAGWDLQDAHVVCRELSCGSASKAFGGALFGQGSGPIWLEGVNCTGEEASLSICPRKSLAEHRCDHSQDASVGCSDLQTIRLVNGTSPCSGRVEVLHNQQWLTVCDEGWDLNSANVVCREIGCSPPLSVPRGAHFGRGHGPAWLTGVHCQGTEATFKECTPNNWQTKDCSHGEGAAVVCSGIRLVNGTNRCSGRVEVLHNQQWLTVCDDGWDLNSAQAVCREHVCGEALFLPRGAPFGRGCGATCLAGAKCRGMEYKFKDCDLHWETHNCSHGEDASVVCSDIRLVNGTSPCSGRVEVFNAGQWGTVCDDGWNLSSAQVVCRQLGCGEALSIKEAAHFGRGNGPILLDEVRCKGTEATLRHCHLQPWGEHNCVHEEDAGVVCSEIRLVNGISSCSGRVEVLHNWQWLAVCDDRWNLTSAQVVCRELGCGEALLAAGGAHFGTGNGPTWLSGVSCQGTEAAFKDCDLQWRTHDCSHGEVASVVCSELRLVNGPSRCSGRIEVLHNRQWGTVCDAGWDLHDAHVVCRELGCGNASKAFGGGLFGQGSGPIWLEGLNCTGEEAFLSECSQSPWGEHSCNHSQDASVECSGDASVEDNIRLGVSALVLVVLVLIVAEAVYSWRRGQL
ncbi:deleted in malignant brain tumors 1 protein-like [Podarcis raffonei]|uniref:deleted in malignant brain tumors 1 protein-like n=1 Tax=Podarcis raffonei TaxID=65483 RepID=UPI0023294C4D|nr:deleted in malignant brain tumors 1 protein-like [Podarcis raffonei]